MPLPTHRLACIALRALQVDAELSPLVKRSFSLTHPDENSTSTSNSNTVIVHANAGTVSNGRVSELAPKANGQLNSSSQDSERLTVLKTEYRATTNRMLRVAVNGFMESLGLVIGVIGELDVDVLDEEG